VGVQPSATYAVRARATRVCNAQQRVFAAHRVAIHTLLSMRLVAISEYAIQEMAQKKNIVVSGKRHNCQRSIHTGQWSPHTSVVNP